MVGTASDCYGMCPSVPQLGYATGLVSLEGFMCEPRIGLCNKVVVIKKTHDYVMITVLFHFKKTAVICNAETKSM